MQKTAGSTNVYLAKRYYGYNVISHNGFYLNSNGGRIENDKLSVRIYAVPNWQNSVYFRTFWLRLCQTIYGQPLGVFQLIVSPED
jgi:hypothetical protein